MVAMDQSNCHDFKYAQFSCCDISLLYWEFCLLGSKILYIHIFFRAFRFSSTPNEELL